MFNYILAFLLVNTYYQSLGNPIQHNSSISDSLLVLAKNCGNVFLANAIKGKVHDCEIPIISATRYHKKQIRCLIFYDINTQLCSAVSASKLSLPDDYDSKIAEKQDVNLVCTFAKDWVFTNLTEYVNYKDTLEKLMKMPATCGEICGVEDVMNEANDYCKYYKWGIETLKTSKPQASTENNVNNNNVEPPVIPEPDSNAKADIAVPTNNNSPKPQISYTKTDDAKSKQVQIAIPNLASENPEEASAISKSTAQTSSKKPITSNTEQNIGKSKEEPQIADIQKPVIVAPGAGTNDQAIKPIVNNAIKPDIQNDPLLPSNDLLDPNDVLQNNDGNASNDAYPDDIDGDDEETDIKPPPRKQETSNRINLPSRNTNNDVSHKEFYPSSDGFSDDGDHFFPFFLTGVILVVLLYILYHNKNKVSKVFFGLILEGRQSNRRRNSRGHAYRRLDTLEQAMSANSAAPPSKIIY